MPETKNIIWTDISIQGDHAKTTIQVSNADFTNVPNPGLDVYPSFINTEEASRILKETTKKSNSFIWEGFEQRRKVWRYSLKQQQQQNNNGNKNLVPSSLDSLATRFTKETGYKPTFISVEEYPKSSLQRDFNNYQSNVTTFESPIRCSCNKTKEGEGGCSCFVGLIPICSSVIQNINRPKRRFVDCWDLYSPDHSTGLILNENSLYLSTNELLWEWRTRISAAGPDHLKNDKFFIIKLHNLPASSSPLEPGLEMSEAKFGYMPNPEHDLPRTEPMPPLHDLLTIIVTTSPIQSNPSTELLKKVFQTFQHGGDDFAYKCRKVIVCDGCRQRTEKTSKKHSNIKQAMRNGIVDDAQFERYAEFKANLKELCLDATDDSPFCNTSVEELESRQGYGFALRHALHECVSTPYVMVVQHDRTFMRPTPVFETVQAMWYHQNIKYVGMSMRSNLLYRDIFLAKYGRRYMDAMRECIIRPPELLVDANEYGPNSSSTTKMEDSVYETLRDNIRALADTYQASQQNIDHLAWLQNNSLPDGKWQLSLTPTFFWYDNVHICETAHYRDFVFDPAYKMVAKGGFVEDKLSPVIKKTVERFGLKHGHARFGSFLLDDHSGMFFTGHLDGGNYLCVDEKRKLGSKNKK